MSDQIFFVAPATGADRIITPRETRLVAAVVVQAGEQASWHYVEFFTANIRTPGAYARASARFLA